MPSKWSKSPARGRFPARGGAYPRNDSLVTDRHPTARARLTLTTHSRAGMALQSFLSGSGEAEHA
jgi:hypothetical protein